MRYQQKENHGFVLLQSREMVGVVTVSAKRKSQYMEESEEEEEESEFMEVEEDEESYCELFCFVST